jgi:hypothetical protein
MFYSKKIFVFLVIGIAFLSFFSTKTIAASIYLSPGAKTVSPGSTFYVSVRENSGSDAVNAVQANLTYPTDQLDFLGVGAGGSAFGIDASSGGSGGSIQIARGSIGQGVTGDRLIATVTFRAKTGGTASVSVAGGSSLVRGSDQANIFSGGAGATYTISGTATTSGSSQKKSTAPTTVTEAAVATPKPLQISNVNASNISYKTVTITWNTNQDASTSVEYGLTDKYGLFAESSNSGTNHSISLVSALLTPGTTYHYRVKSIDVDRQEATSTDATFTLRGIDVKVQVTNQQGITIENSKVSLVTPQKTYTQTTDSNGVTIFNNVPPTNNTIITDVQGVQTTKVIAVKEPSAEEIQKNQVATQRVEVHVASAYKEPSTTKINGIRILIFGGIIVILSLGILYFVRMRRKGPPKINMPANTTT